MYVNEVLDDIEQILSMNGKQSPDRLIILKWMGREMGSITAKVPADCFYIHLDPVIITVVAKRNYTLPVNFPMNFANNAGDSGNEHCCLIDDGDTEAVITYESPEQFYAKSLTSESDGKPSTYTILTLSSGRKEIVFSPPPDAVYQIDGVYSPTDWSFTAEGQMPAFPSNNLVLEHAVLKRILPNYEALYRDSLNDLVMTVARSRGSKMIPVMGRNASNEYSQMRRRM